VWHDDPRRLTFLLSRYKFVSKMFAGKANVAELGCGDAFDPFAVQAQFGIGTRSTASQANNKAELL
jgi:hypothetical protein